MPTKPTPPESDALDAHCARGLHYIRLSDMRCASCGYLYTEGPLLMMEDAALSAFRAVAVALVRRAGDARHPGTGECAWCDSVVPVDKPGTPHAPTCPVALARAALEKFPEADHD